MDRVQNGKSPDDWKVMHSVGSGAMEIRIGDASGTFRVVYVAKFAEAVFVRHCFRKTTEKTSQADVDLAAGRYRRLVRELRQ